MIKSRKTRRKINRSGRGSCPVCGRVGILVDHHIDGRDGPDSSRAYNIASLCASCHEDCHSGIIILEGYFMTGEGMTLMWHMAGEESMSGRDAQPYIR